MYPTLAIVSLLLATAACGTDSPAQSAGPPGGAKPVEVGVVTVTPRPITLTRELPGRTSAYRVAEVRARVNGIVQKRLFEEGADVKAGQPLFRIDPAPYQAAFESAQAQVARAQAQVDSATTLTARYEPLVAASAISRQEYDDAEARLKTARADLAAARAAQKAARINLDYTTVTAPIAGRIGRAEVTEGAYVQQASATLLATVQQLDRLYVDLTWSSAEALRLRRAVESGEITTTAGAAAVTIVLEDGRAYGTPGTLQFTDASVDATTGSILLRAVVPNPRGELLPGMFVRARLDEGTNPTAILVPQKAVTRDQNGRPVALVVGKDSKVERRQLVTDRAVGDAWLVTGGLVAGESVIVEGIQKARPGTPVKPVPASVGVAQGAVAPGPPPAPAPPAAAPPTAATPPTPTVR